MLERCDALARCSDEPGALSRPFLCGSARMAMEQVERWMREAGLETGTDAVGNVRGRLEGRSNQTFLIGSHLDTVPGAGRYDGVLGVLLGLEIAAALTTSGQLLHHSLELIAFSEEEGVRFGFPFIGSSAVAGTFDPGWLERRDGQGVTLRDCLLDFGLNPQGIPQAALDPTCLRGYFELHIEQGPVLEALDAPLGVVTGIVGQSRLTLWFVGQAAHAGTTPMALRRDALAAASSVVLKAERMARGIAGLSATVGRLEVWGGAGNVVPGEVEFSLDVRHPDDAARAVAVQGLLGFARATARRRGLAFHFASSLEQSAVPCDPQLTAALERAVAAAGLPLHTLPSGAGHDAMVFGGRCPISMLFLRSPGGISHNPLEAVLEGDVQAALEVGLSFVREQLGTAQGGHDV